MILSTCALISLISENSSSSVVVVVVDGSLFEVANNREEGAIDFDFIGCENDDARLLLPAEAGDDDGSLRAMMAVPSLSILLAVMAA